ncbi:pyridoxal-phosphate dependent enzyme [Millisia brevis]|uniref:pyridoxal-phosphate dependent enzyme n=1 Tax=Millisia brevis TaxID=264148 RepID=UPI000A061E54|nr:pyridoxal-phosphate dependent enzyme [Millisia brevis]
MAIYDSVLSAVGNTPLVRLNRLTEGISARVYVKLEYLNPGGSVKDRAARQMVEDAERSGALIPGGTIVEGSSGNTGIGLAQAAAGRGYHLVVVVPDNVSIEKQDLLRAYGAELIVTPAGHPRDHPDHVSNIAERIASERPDAWFAHQYDNPGNPEAHRRTTGPEIWRDTEGTVTHLVAGIGTGGTISGTGEYLKQVADGQVQVIGADPVSSVYNGGDGSPFFVEAAGHYLHPDTPEDVWPQSYHPDVVDHIVAIPDRESVATIRELAAREGLLVGGSAGLVTAAALRVARDLGPEHTVVAVLPDSGRAYLSKYHSRAWQRRLGFLDDDRTGLLAELVGEVEVPAAGRAVTLAEAAALVRSTGATILPVVLREHSILPAAFSEIRGVIGRRELLARAEREPHRAVGEIATPPPATVGTGETAAEAIARLGEELGDHVTVLRDGRLAGILAAEDLHRAAARDRAAAVAGAA